MKSVLKPFPSRRLSKTKFFYWEPTAANKPSIYLATESKSRREAGREGGREGCGRVGGGRGGEGFSSPSCSLFFRKDVIISSREGGVGRLIRAQWPRLRAQATCKASFCSWLLDQVSSWALLDSRGSLLTNLGFLPFFPTLACLTPLQVWPMPAGDLHNPFLVNSHPSVRV